MGKFRRKIVIVEATQWQPHLEIDGVKLTAPDRGSLIPRGIVKTVIGTFVVNSGDWIVTGLDGRKWVVEGSMFDALYTAVSPCGFNHHPTCTCNGEGGDR